MQQAEPALRIAEPHPGQARKLPAHETVGDATHKRHCARRVHSLACNEGDTALLGSREKLRDVRRSVLPIAIHAKNPFEAQLVGVLPTSAQRRAFTHRLLIPKHGCARRPRSVAGGIKGTVIHYQNGRQEGLNRGDDFADGRGLVEARDESGTLLLPNHRQSLSQARLK